MSALHPVAATPSIGPVFVKGEVREHYAHELGETASLTDRVFQDKSASVQLKFRDYQHANPLKVAAPLDHDVVVEKYRDMIQEHVERRIFFFFQQLIVCYQTKLHFEASGAKDQAKSADRIVLTVKGKREVLSARQAAHSSTLPCLIAYDQRQWEAYQDGDRAIPQGIVFLKGTDYYRSANATMNMPKWINDADREIDEKTKDSLLREKGLAIVNRASQGRIAPDRGILEFLEEALEEVRCAKERLEEKDKDPEVQQVLGMYEEYFAEFQEKIESDPLFLEHFLNLKIDSKVHNQTAQRKILQIRYAAIRNSQVSQAKMIQKVEAVRKQILGEVQGVGRKPAYFDGAFRTLLVKQGRTPQDRKRLETLFNFSPFDFEAKLETARKKTQFETIKTTLSRAGHLEKINECALDVLSDMRHLRTEEAFLRAQTIKELRAMKGWQQWRLGQEVKKLFPNAAASQPTICRIERRQKLVTPQIAEEFSRTFQVDSGLFMPHFFYD